MFSASDVASDLRSGIEDRGVLLNLTKAQLQEVYEELNEQCTNWEGDSLSAEDNLRGALAKDEINRLLA